MNDLFDNSFYRDVKRSFQLLGCWPYQARRIRAIILLFYIFDVGTFQFPQVWYFVEQFNNMKEMVNCLSSLGICYLSNVSLCCILFYSNELKQVFESMKINWKNAIDPEEKSILVKHAKRSYIKIRIYIGIGFIAITVYCLMPLFARTLNVLFPDLDPQPVDNIVKSQYYHLDPKKYYLFIYLHSFHIVYFVILGIVIYDIYIIMTIEHASSMYAVLRYKLSNIGKRIVELQMEMSKQELDQVISIEFKNSIRYHQSLIRFTESIDETIKNSYLIQIFVNAGLITFFGVQALTNSNKPIHLISFSFNVISMIVRLFCINWCGQQVFNDNERLSNEICNIPWYNDFPPKSKRLFLIMLMRSYQPCKLTAGGVIDLNLQSFSWFLKLSMSYFTMILSTQK